MPPPKVRIGQSPIQGAGVFACTHIAAGELLLTIDDTHALDDAHPAPDEEQRYLDFLSAGKIVVMQIPERHINHSCDPNAFIQTRNHKRKVIALRPIRTGEEITFDYSINGTGNTLWTCACNSPHCRHSIHSNFFDLPIALQKEYLPLLDEWFRTEYAELLQTLVNTAT